MQIFKSDADSWRSGAEGAAGSPSVRSSSLPPGVVAGSGDTQWRRRSRPNNIIAEKEERRGGKKLLICATWSNEGGRGRQMQTAVLAQARTAFGGSSSAAAHSGAVLPS